ncbi:MAG: dockerin type I repeat-containing protein [Clostridia bacterium]|nr:dockerin type I repeat-containing protein [Clostridia bacterium]
MNKQSTRIVSMLVTVGVLLAMLSAVILPAVGVEGLFTEEMPTVQEALFSAAKNYKITSVEDLVFLMNHESLFDGEDTVYLAADLNLKDADFTGFEGLKASFDGLGHMLYNWTAESRGLFYNCPMASIKNLTLYKVTLDASGLGSGQWPALIFGMQQNALSSLQPAFTMENVHVLESELIRPSIKDTGAAVLLSRYRTSQLVTVKITGCSVVNTAITGTAPNNNVGAVMGGISINNTAGSTFELKNILINGYQHLNAANHCGILLGEVRKNVTAENIAVYNSSVAAYGNENGDVCDASVLGRVFADTISFKNVMIAGNTLSSEEGSCFIVAKNGSPSLTLTDVYCDSELTAVEGTTQTVTCLSAEAFRSGEAAYLAGWTMENGLPAFAAGNETRRITVGDTVLYGDTREEVDLSAALPGKVFTGAAMNETATGLVMPAADVTLTAYDADTPAGEVAAALAYFALRDVKYYADGLADAIADAEAQLLSGTVTDAATLNGYKGNYSEVYAPVSEAELYPGMAGFMILNTEDLLDAEDRELTEDQTLYLGADLDLTGVAFEGLYGLSCAFDGMGHTVKNWTAVSRGFLDWYKGYSVKNIVFENVDLTWNTSDGVGLVIGRRVGDTGFALENVHVKDSKVTNDGYVTEDGGAILLGTVSRPVGETDHFTFGAGQTVTIKDCSVTDTAIGGEARPRVAAVMGHIWGGFDHAITNVTVTGFESNAEGSGILLGEVEGSAVTLTNVGIFGCSGGDSAVAALGDGAEVIAEDLLAADSGALTAGVLYSDSFADTDAEGVTTLESAAFQNGEAAWKANAGEEIWKVGEGFGYPTLGEGTVPYRITFGEEHHYTDADGVLLLAEEEAERLAASTWYYSDNTVLVDLAAIFTADTVLTSAVPGDLDGDKLVTTADVVLLMQHLVGYDVTFAADADISGDGRISIFDAVSLLKQLSV